MKIAIPVWDKRLSPVFDTASRLLVVEIEDQKEASRFEIILEEQDLPRRCLRIHNLGIDILICGAISRSYSRMLTASGVDIIPEISGHTDEVLEAYLQGTLFHSRFLMPGCRSHRIRQRRGLASFEKSRRRKRLRGGFFNEKKGV